MTFFDLAVTLLAIAGATNLITYIVMKTYAQFTS